MANYTEVRGVVVRKVGAEPSPLVEGEVFYRTDTQKYYYVQIFPVPLRLKK